MHVCFLTELWKCGELRADDERNPHDPLLGLILGTCLRRRRSTIVEGAVSSLPE